MSDTKPEDILSPMNACMHKEACQALLLRRSDTEQIVINFERRLHGVSVQRDGLNNQLSKYRRIAEKARDLCEAVPPILDRRIEDKVRELLSLLDEVEK